VYIKFCNALYQYKLMPQLSLFGAVSDYAKTSETSSVNYTVGLCRPQTDGRASKDARRRFRCRQLRMIVSDLSACQCNEHTHLQPHTTTGWPQNPGLLEPEQRQYSVAHNFTECSPIFSLHFQFTMRRCRLID